MIKDVSDNRDISTETCAGGISSRISMVEIFYLSTIRSTEICRVYIYKHNECVVTGRGPDARIYYKTPRTLNGKSD